MALDKISLFNKTYTSEREKLAYLAAIVEFHGSFVISQTKKDNRCYGQVTLSSFNSEVIDLLVHFFGGKKIENRKKKITQKSGRIYYIWNCVGKSIDEFVKIITPYLVFKRNNAELMLQFRETFNKSGRFLAPNVAAQRIEIREKMIKLNHDIFNRGILEKQ